MFNSLWQFSFKEKKSFTNEIIAEQSNNTHLHIKMKDHDSSYSNHSSQSKEVPTLGIMFALVSVLCFSFNSVIVKLLKSNYDMSGLQVLVIRSILQFIICLVIILIKRYSFHGFEQNKYLVSRALTGTISLGCLFTAFSQRIPIGDVTTIYYTSPVFVTIFAFFMLKEAFQSIQMLTCVMTIVGVIFISKPDFIFGDNSFSQQYQQKVNGQVLSIIAALTSSLTIIFLRKLQKTPSVVVVFWFSFSIVIFGFWALYLTKQLKPIDWTDMMCVGLLTLIGLMSVIEQCFFALALQHENATTISVVRSFNIVLAFIWEVVIFKEIITWTSIVGGVIVSACIILLAIAKNWSQIKKFVKKSLAVH